MRPWKNLERITKQAQTIKTDVGQHTPILPLRLFFDRFQYRICSPGQRANMSRRRSFWRPTSTFLTKAASGGKGGITTSMLGRKHTDVVSLCVDKSMTCSGTHTDSVLLLL